MIDLYKNIKSRRMELGLSQGALANMVGYSDRTSIAKIESGKVDLPQSKIVAFAEALKTTPADLMGWVDIDHILPKDSLGPDNDLMDNITVLAAHHDNEDWTDEELQELENFKDYLLSKRQKD